MGTKKSDKVFKILKSQFRRARRDVKITYSHWRTARQNLIYKRPSNADQCIYCRVKFTTISNPL